MIKNIISLFKGKGKLIIRNIHTKCIVDGSIRIKNRLNIGKTWNQADTGFTSLVIKRGGA